MSRGVNAVALDSGRTMFNSQGGRWAAEQFLKQLKAGKPMSTDALRTLDTLQRDEWKFFDDVVIEEAKIRLRAVGDLLSRGLTKSVTNGLGKTLYEYERMTDMNPAQLSLDGVTRSENDRVEFDPANLPLPIMHKDYWINLRTLMASRTRGESLDTTQARVAGRLVAEGVEDLLINGTAKKYAGASIYGYTTHPSRATSAFGSNGDWAQSAKTGDNIVTDTLTMLSAMHTRRCFGPYVIYVPSDAGVKLENDFKANSDLTIRQRLLQIEGIASVTTLDTLASSSVLMVQMTEDTVCMVEGEPLQTIQWDVEGGMVLNFKVMTIQVPLIRGDAQGRLGIYHMSD